MLHKSITHIFERRIHRYHHQHYYYFQRWCIDGLRVEDEPAQWLFLFKRILQFLLLILPTIIFYSVREPLTIFTPGWIVNKSCSRDGACGGQLYVNLQLEVRLLGQRKRRKLRRGGRGYGKDGAGLRRALRGAGLLECPIWGRALNGFLSRWAFRFAHVQTVSNRGERWELVLGKDRANGWRASVARLLARSSFNFATSHLRGAPGVPPNCSSGDSVGAGLLRVTAREGLRARPPARVGLVRKMAATGLVSAGSGRCCVRALGAGANEMLNCGFLRISVEKPAKFLRSGLIVCW